MLFLSYFCKCNTPFISCTCELTVFPYVFTNLLFPFDLKRFFSPLHYNFSYNCTTNKRLPTSKALQKYFVNFFSISTRAYVILMSYFARVCFICISSRTNVYGFDLLRILHGLEWVPKQCLFTERKISSVT